MSERGEAWMRIVVLIVSGIILGVWKVVAEIVVIIHWIVVVFGGKRDKDFAEFALLWGAQVYSFYRYMMFHTNVRPFPFTQLRRIREQFEKK